MSELTGASQQRARRRAERMAVTEAVQRALKRTRDSMGGGAEETVRCVRRRVSGHTSSGGDAAGVGGAAGLGGGGAAGHSTL